MILITRSSSPWRIEKWEIIARRYSTLSFAFFFSSRAKTVRWALIVRCQRLRRPNTQFVQWSWILDHVVRCNNRIQMHVGAREFSLFSSFVIGNYALGCTSAFNSGNSSTIDIRSCDIAGGKSAVSHKNKWRNCCCRLCSTPRTRSGYSVSMLVSGYISFILTTRTYAILLSLLSNIVPNISRGPLLQRAMKRWRRDASRFPLK